MTSEPQHVGYVWNGIVHHSRSRALAGAMVFSGLTTMLHVAMPTFDAHKSTLSLLLDLEIWSDPDGELHAKAHAAPVLPPFSMQATRDYLGELFLYVLPVTELSDEEFAKMDEKGSLRIGFRGCAYPSMKAFTDMSLSFDYMWRHHQTPPPWF